MSVTPSGKKPGPSAAQTPPANFEVLPPEGKAGAARPGVPGSRDEMISRLIAYVMDNLIKIPGTKARVGVNPFLDLIPFVGDGAAMFISAATILEGARRGVPKVVLTRMGLNILLNGVIGTIPAVGEAFAFWFKPSSRNYQLLVQHSPAAGTTVRRNTARDWAFVVGLVAVLLIILGALIGVGFYVIAWLFHALFH